MYEIDHVAIAVEDLEPAIEDFADAAGTDTVWTYASEEWEYRTTYVLAGDDMLTLIEPTTPESFIADYLDRRGPGVHHLGVSVEDLEATVMAMTAAGAEVIMEDIIKGVREEATVHPKSWYGVQFQFIEWHPDVGSGPRDHVAAMRAAKEDGRL